MGSAPAMHDRIAKAAPGSSGPIPASASPLRAGKSADMDTGAAAARAAPDFARTAPIVPALAALRARPSHGPSLAMSSVDQMAVELQRRAVAPLGGMGFFGRAVDEPGLEQAEPEPAPVGGAGSSGPAIQFACAEGCACATCSAAKPGDEGAIDRRLRAAGVQRAAAPDGGPPRVEPGSIQTHLRGGAVLPAPIAHRFSEAYGRDLSGVQIHTHSPAARDLGARAFTVGRTVAFAPGEYRPGSGDGDRLIAHELAHVVQQSGGVGAIQGSGLDTNAYEAEADRAADRALAGGTVDRLTPLARASVQRQDPPAAVLAKPPNPTIAEQYPELAFVLFEDELAVLEAASSARYAAMEPGAGKAAAPEKITIELGLDALLTTEARFVDQDIWSTLYGVLRAGGGDELSGELLRNEMMRRYFQKSGLSPKDTVTVTLLDPEGKTPGPSRIKLEINGTTVSDTEGQITPVDLANGFGPLEPVIADVSSDAEKVGLAAQIVDELDDVAKVVDRLATADPKDQRLRELRGVATRLRADKPFIDEFAKRKGPTPAAAASASERLADLAKKMQATLDAAIAWRARNDAGKSLGQYNEKAGTWLAGKGLSEIDKGGIHYVSGGLAIAGAFVVAFVDAGEKLITFGYHDTATAVSEAWERGDITWNEGEEILSGAFRRAILVAALTRGLGSATSRLGVGFATGLGLAPRSLATGLVGGGIGGTLTGAGTVAAQALLTKSLASRFEDKSTARAILDAEMPTARTWILGIGGGAFFGSLGVARGIQASNARLVGQIEMTPSGPMRVVAVTPQGYIVYEPIAPVRPTPYGPMRVVTVTAEGIEVLEPVVARVKAPAGGPAQEIVVAPGWKPSTALQGRPPVVTGEPLLVDPRGVPLLLPPSALSPLPGVDPIGPLAGDPLAIGPGAGALAPRPQAPPRTGRDLVATYLKMLKSGGPEAPEVLVRGFAEIQSGGVSSRTGPLVTLYNPSGLDTNCGFCAISRALHVTMGPSGFVNADDLYLQTLRDLGLPLDTTEDPVSRMLIFPEPSFYNTGHPGNYGALYKEGDNKLASYTITSVARARGLELDSMEKLFIKSRLAFDPNTQAATDAWAETLRENPAWMNRSDAEIEKQARLVLSKWQTSLPGEYIIGSRGAMHFMNVTIRPNGAIEGFDPQDGASYSGIDAILGRMKNTVIDLVLKVR